MDPSLLKRHTVVMEVNIEAYDDDCCSILHLNECPGLIPSQIHNRDYMCRFFNKRLLWKKNETHTVPVRCDECKTKTRKDEVLLSQEK